MAVPDIYDTFKGKNVFFTGVTGFVGKVYLFKLLKEFPDIGTIYCLCRPKKGVSMEDRFAKQVLSSPCFQPLIDDLGDAEWKRRAAKCKAVPGDITHHRLGIDDKDYAELEDKVNIILHLAATVDFQEKINISCQMNVLGSIRVMSLAHRCRHLESYIHCSTCYVNWNRHGGGPVKEQLYDLGFDAENMLKFILSLDNGQIPAVTKELLSRYKYPNTYTFTKSITEHILMKQRGNLPFVIVRPAIIGASWREPYNGWVDALTAAGGIFLAAGLGLMHELVVDPNHAADVVPCDHVVNLILKVTHRTMVYHKPTSYGKIEGDANSSVSPLSREVVIVGATGKQAAAGELGVPTAGGVAQRTSRAVSANDSDPGSLSLNFPRMYQSSTSSTQNPLAWKVIESSLIPYWNGLKHPKMLGPAFFNFHSNKYSFAVNFFVRRQLPIKLAQMANSVPGIRDPKREKLLKRYEKAVARVLDLNHQFYPFTTNTWQFEGTNAELLETCISTKAQQAFSTDVFDINWFHYGISYSWGMIKFIMKDNTVKDVPMPQSGPAQVFRASL